MTQQPIATTTDSEIESDLRQIIATEAARHNHDRLAFMARELAQACGISPRDVIDLTHGLCQLWTVDGEKFLSFEYLGMYLRVYGASDVKMDFRREDCGKLIDVLLQREGGAQ